MTPTHQLTTRASVERIARESYGRLVAWLAWRCGDLAAAEDAMGEALLKALGQWPERGVPEQPDSWLLTVARREFLQKLRHDKLGADPALGILFESEEAPSAQQIPDARLRLMAVCCHPAIDQRVRIPLMLQTVLGLEVSQIAPAMLMSPATLMQRLVRAKQKIKLSGIRFSDADVDELPANLNDILEAIYGLFSLSYQFADGVDANTVEFETEALFLSELVARLAPDDAEATGLWCLIAFVTARRPARSNAAGRFVPLTEQDVSQWDRSLIQRADQRLWQAAQKQRPGPLQLEAAIQSAHCQRLFTGQIPWPGIAQLYAVLVALHPTVGAVVGYAVALGESGQVQQGLQQLDLVAQETARHYQPWWVARAHLFALRGDALSRESALQAYRIALGLTTDVGVRAHLNGKINLLS